MSRTPAPGLQNDGPRQRARRRRREIRRRRAVAVLLLFMLVAVAVAVPLAVRGEESGGTALASDTTAGSEPFTAGELPTAGEASTAGSSSPDGSDSDLALSSPTSTTSTVADLSVTPERARMLGANELGLIPVLMYHKIGQDIVPPQRLRQDIALLKSAGFYPTTIRELAEGRMDIPAGRSPVVLTFDDSSPTHYRILEDGTLDPDCAVAIMQDAVAAGDWAPKATFFPLLYVNPPANILFGQPEYADQKLRNLVDWGYEIGSHTLTHQDLSVAASSRLAKELAESQAELETRIDGGYEVYTLSPPYGEYPDDWSVLVSGSYEGLAYHYAAVVKAWGSSGPSPFSSNFDPIRIPRITAYPTNTVPDLVEYFRTHPELRFVSDGDPDVVSVPLNLAEELGDPRTDLSQKVVLY